MSEADRELDLEVFRRMCEAMHLLDLLTFPLAEHGHAAMEAAQDVVERCVTTALKVVDRDRTSIPDDCKLFRLGEREAAYRELIRKHAQCGLSYTAPTGN